MNRFRLEERITDCWSVVNDIEMLYEYVGDHPYFKDMKPEHCDEICNLLLGLNKLYELKFNMLWNCFEECISSEEV